jgi:hypothetical protein
LGLCGELGLQVAERVVIVADGLVYGSGGFGGGLRRLGRLSWFVVYTELVQVGQQVVGVASHCEGVELLV